MSNFTSLNSFIPMMKLGQGSFSSVYKVKRINDQQIYALKKIKIAYLKQKEKANALNQIRILASLNSPYIVSYKEAFFDQKLHLLCIVLEWANQGDLLKLINERKEKKKKIAEEEIWKAAYHILSGLQILHRNCILHRDIKSANIFINDGSYKLGDLNVSKVNDQQQRLVQTQTGTPFYASPEIWRDQPYGSQSDIWSFGCIIYQMCCLKPPFNGKDLNELYKNVQRGSIEPIPAIYSRQLQKLIRSCLSQKPKDRPKAIQLLKYGGTILTRCQFYEIQTKRVTDPTGKQSLLQTIKMPTDIKKLNSKLPQPNYQSNFEDEQKGKTLIKVHSSYKSQSNKQAFSNLFNNQSQIIQFPSRQSQNPSKLRQKIEVIKQNYSYEQKMEHSARLLKDKALSKKLLDYLTPIKQYDTKRKRPISCNYLHAHNKKQDKKPYFIKDLNKYVVPAPGKVYNSDRKSLARLKQERQLVSDRKNFNQVIKNSYHPQGLEKNKNRCRSANHQQSAMQIFNDLKRRLQSKYNQLQPSALSSQSQSDRNLLKYKSHIKSEASLNNPKINYSYGSPSSLEYGNPLGVKSSIRGIKNEAKYLDQVQRKIMSNKMKEKKSQPLLDGKRSIGQVQPQIKRIIKGSNFKSPSRL